MYFCGYFSLSNGQNWGSYMHNTSSWGYFWWKFRYLTPRVTIYRVTPYCSDINFVEIPSGFGLNIFLWLLSIIKWSKLGSDLHKTNIWVVFFVKFWVLGTLRWPYIGLPPTVQSLICTNTIIHWFLWILTLSNGPNWEVFFFCLIPVFGVIFW